MNPKIYIDKEGIIKYIEDWPSEKVFSCPQCEGKGWITGIERPCGTCNPGGEWRSSKTTLQKLNEALSKAKQEAVEFAEQRLIKAFIIEDINTKENRKAFELFINSSFKPDTLYSLPSGIEVEVRKPICNECEGTYDPKCKGLCTITPRIKERYKNKVPLAYIKSSPQKDDDDFQKYLDGWINLCHKTIEAEKDDLKIIKAGNTLATLELVKLKYNSLSERFTITRNK